jgi:hypothetical protein
MSDQDRNDLRNAERAIYGLQERIATLEDLLREVLERIRVLNAPGQG